MFNIGGGEVLVIALIALIVLGPKRLPDAARQVGKAMGELRRLSNGFQAELRDAFADAETTAPTGPRRDVLGAPPQSASPVADAAAAVSKQAPARRTPLRAAPLEATTGESPALRPAKGATSRPVNGSSRAPVAARKASPSARASRPSRDA